MAPRGESNAAKDLPPFLRKKLPDSVSAMQQEFKAKVQHIWKRRWKRSPRYHRLASIDKSTLSKKWMKLVRPLMKKQAAIIIQL